MNLCIIILEMCRCFTFYGFSIIVIHMKYHKHSEVRRHSLTIEIRSIHTQQSTKKFGEDLSA